MSIAAPFCYLVLGLALWCEANEDRLDFRFEKLNMADYDFSPAATCIPLQEPKRPLENANTPTDQRPKRHSCSLLSGSKGQLENADPSASQ